ncbi:MAG TPA: serine/threonine-protein kinase, partial [Gemmataceae bacterium]|nr:serine/threonine-protein kinase [Gemmataceae bacterium]
GRVKVLDFGLAGVATGESSGLTGGNVVIGTPDYISPEQAEDARTADTRSDVYSLGCTLYHLLAGRPPFPTDAVLKKLDAHRLHAPQPLTAIRQDMTPALAELVAKMLAKDPADRPQTPGEVAVALEQILAGRGGGPPAPARRWWGGGGRWRRRWRRVAVGALVLLGALGAVAYKLTDKADISVSNEAPDQVKWVIKKDGYVVSEPSSALLTSLFLPAGGGYTVELDGPDEFVARPKSFAVRRGEKLTIRVVRVTREPQPATDSPAAPADVGWTDLIPLVDELQATEKGKVVRDGTGPNPALVVRSMYDEYARIRLPFRPAGSYEVRATIARTGGDDAFVLSLPVPGGPGANPNVTLFVDDNLREGAWSGLRFVDSNQPGVWMNRAFGRRLARDERYPLYVRVVVAGDTVAIRAELSDKVLVDWSGQANEFSGGSIWSVADNSRLALGVVKSTYRVERLEARPLPVQTPAPARFLLHGKPNAPFTELIPYIDPSLDREAGALGSYSQAYLRVGSDAKGPARVALPARPEGDYEFRARIARLSGDGSFNLMLPVPGTGGKVQIGVLVDTVRSGRGFVVLDWPGGPDSPLEKTPLKGRLKPGQQYLVLARVTRIGPRVQIAVSVNGESVIEWTGTVTEDRNGTAAFTRDRRQLGFGASAAEFRIDRLEFRVLNGTADLSRPAPAAKTPVPPPTTPEGTRELAGDPDAPWVSLLEGLNLPTSILTGSWGWSGGFQDLALVAGNPGQTGGRFGLPVWPKGDYEVRIRLTRVAGNDALVVLLPIPVAAATQTALITDGPGGFVGLAAVNKQPAGTLLKDTLGRRLTNGREYTLLVRVTAKDGQATVRSEIDGTRTSEWSGPIADLTPSPTWSTVDRGQLGLGVADHCQFHLKGVDFRPLSASAEWSPGKAAAPAAEKPGPVARFGRYKGAVLKTVLSPDGRQVFAGEDGVSKWDLAAKRMAWALDAPPGALVALSGDGRVLLVVGDDGQARVLDPADGTEKRHFPIHSERVAAAVLNRDGTRALISQLSKKSKGVNPAIRAWDVVNGKELFRLDGHTDDTYGLALSPDGSRVATASYDETVRLWDAETGKQIHKFTAHTAPVSAVAYSADGKYLVSGGGDDQVRVWGIEEKRCVSLLSGHTEWVTDVAFTPDGTRVVSVSGYEGKGDGVRVWDWRTGDQLDHFARASGAIGSVAVIPDGQSAVTGEHSGEVRVWRLPGPPVPKPETVGPVRRFGRFAEPTGAVTVSK